MTACTREGIDLHRASNCFGGIFAQQRGRTSVSFYLHLLGASRIVGEIRVIHSELSLKHSAQSDSGRGSRQVATRVEYSMSIAVWILALSF